MENIATFIAVVGPMIFTSNLLMSAVKWLADQSISRGWLRCILAVFSILGAISTSALLGVDVDFDSISSMARLAAEAAGIGFGSHYTYRAIKEAPSPTQ